MQVISLITHAAHETGGAIARQQQLGNRMRIMSKCQMQSMASSTQTQNPDSAEATRSNRAMVQRTQELQ